MFSNQRFILVIALLAFLAPPAFADELLSFKAGYLTLNPEGKAAVSENAIAGTIVDLEGDLALDGDDSYFAEAAFQFADFRLFAAYLPINFSGENLLTQSVNFNGETFAANSRVKTDVEINIYEAGLAWFMINLDDTPLRVQFGPEISAKYVDVSIDLQNVFSSQSASDSAHVAVPSVGARLRVGVADYLGVIGRIGYMEYNDNSFMDVDAQVEFSPLPLVGLYAGYRYLDIDVNESDVFIDATFSGPYAGAMVRF